MSFFEKALVSYTTDSVNRAAAGWGICLKNCVVGETIIIEEKIISPVV